VRFRGGENQEIELRFACSFLLTRLVIKAV
jgi:hypothetical protein